MLCTATSFNVTVQTYIKPCLRGMFSSYSGRRSLCFRGGLGLSLRGTCETNTLRARFAHRESGYFSLLFTQESHDRPVSIGECVVLQRYQRRLEEPPARVDGNSDDESLILKRDIVYSSAKLLAVVPTHARIAPIQ